MHSAAARQKHLFVLFGGPHIVASENEKHFVLDGREKILIEFYKGLNWPARSHLIKSENFVHFVAGREKRILYNIATELIVQY